MVEVGLSGGDAIPVWRNDIGESQVTIQSYYYCKVGIYVPVPLKKN